MHHEDVLHQFFRGFIVQNALILFQLLAISVEVDVFGVFETSAGQANKRLQHFVEVARENKSGAVGGKFADATPTINRQLQQRG